MPTTYSSRPSVTTTFTGRPSIAISNTMPVLITGLWNDTLLWDDTLFWNDTGNVTVTIFTGRTLI